MNPWLIDYSLPEGLILGADVFHSRTNKSASSIVSRFGERFQKTYCTSQLHQRKYEEIIAGIQTMVVEHIDNYFK